ncbi:MAG TPA: ABC transporter ATP-binding protein [bacterium]|uniref:Lipoprotein-releasing system ATP-binding protein LolD n=1 Tax=candidate division TA06 bacterium ADurb.Bin417 TaxID=1852828 RepID=A0A1V5MDX3_UNCT6|nr:MAG: Lipoprotein-releasing system ATP-binding protein LolD [candidate division TA06 bacterium ADurb.Bin417]HNQ35479.1 ABC transporter ATP-binding protein [bacterium]HNS49419.1 ABC transporter ATP-binding protein [bacterium]
MAAEVIRLDGISKIYRIADVEVAALKNLSLTVREGEHISIVGPSGSGKTTLLNLLGCLDRPSSGNYFLDGQEISKLDDDALSHIRSQKLGFVFQSYNLIPQLTVLENIGLPLFYQYADESAIQAKALELARIVGLGNRLYHRPFELSGGQQQRVAIARALINDSVIVLADEPTGNLDSSTGREVMDLLLDLNHKGTTLLLITHDPKVAAFGQRTIHMLDGEIVDET